MQDTIGRIRSASFTLARRGYDRREVDNYLSKLADWLEGGGANQIHSNAIRQELERIGRKTTKVLTAAQQAAESMRTEAEHDAQQITEDARIHAAAARSTADEYAREVRAEVQGITGTARGQAESESRRIRSEAEAHSAKTRQDADAYSERLRNEADAYAEQIRSGSDANAAETIKAAEAKAVRMVEEGTRRRREIEKVIADLQTRRDAVVKGLEKLSSQLAGAVGASTEPASPAGSAPKVAAQPPAAHRQ